VQAARIAERLLRRRLSPRSGVILLALFTVLAIAVGATLELWVSYVAQLQQGRHLAHAVALMTNNQVERVFGATETLLDDVAGQVVAEPALDPTTNLANPLLPASVLRGVLVANADLDVVYADGGVALGQRVARSPLIDRVLESKSTVLLGAPATAEQLGFGGSVPPEMKLLPLARTFSSVAGGTGGIVVAGLDPDFLGPIKQGALPDIRDQVLLFDPAGALLAATTQGEPPLNLANAEGGTWLLASVGSARYGTTIVVALRRADVLSGWLPLVYPTIIGALAVIVVLLLLTYLLLGRLQSDARARESLQRVAVELRTARDEAEAATRAKTEFLANMTHELRTPLNAILGFSGLIRQTPDTARLIEEYAGYIQDSGEHLLKIIEDVLDMSRLADGNYELGELRLDLAEVADSCRALLRRRLDFHQVRLAVDLPDPVRWAEADPKALKQILLHLLSNAVKASPAGGTVSLRAYRDPGGDLVIEIVDRGAGLPAEVLLPLRRMLADPRPETAVEVGAPGFGLAICSRLARLHGGSLDLRSEEGGGAVATLRLPGERLVPPPGGRAA